MPRLKYRRGGEVGRRKNVVLYFGIHGLVSRILKKENRYQRSALPSIDTKCIWY